MAQEGGGSDGAGEREVSGAVVGEGEGVGKGGGEGGGGRQM